MLFYQEDFIDFIDQILNSVESPRTSRDGVCVLLQITNAVGSSSFEKRSGNAVQSP
jgi:hypothetical protein